MLTKLEFTEAVPLTSGVKSGGEYTLSWDPQGLPETWTEGSIKLIDLHTDRILSLNKAGEYSFEVDGRGSTFDSNSQSKESTSKSVGSKCGRYEQRKIK